MSNREVATLYGTYLKEEVFLMIDKILGRSSVPFYRNIKSGSVTIIKRDCQNVLCYYIMFVSCFDMIILQLWFEPGTMASRMGTG